MAFHRFVLLLALISPLTLFGKPVEAAPITNFVTAGDFDWAQPTDFLGLSWYSIDEVCPEATGGVCNDDQLLGNDMLGWTWASFDDVGDLFTNLGTPHDLREVDSSWAPDFMDIFDSVSGLNYEVVWGTSRTIHPVADFASFAPMVINGFDGFVDVASIGNPDDRALENTERGGWFYRDSISVPEPSIFVLMFTGLLGLSIARRYASK